MDPKFDFIPGHAIPTDSFNFFNEAKKSLDIGLMAKATLSQDEIFDLCYGIVDELSVGTTSFKMEEGMLVSSDTSVDAFGLHCAIKDCSGRPESGSFLCLNDRVKQDEEENLHPGPSSKKVIVTTQTSPPASNAIQSKSAPASAKDTTFKSRLSRNKGVKGTSTVHEITGRAKLRDGAINSSELDPKNAGQLPNPTVSEQKAVGSVQVPEPPPKKQKIVEQPPKILSRGSSTPSTKPSSKVVGGEKGNFGKDKKNFPVFPTKSPASRGKAIGSVQVPEPPPKKQKIVEQPPKIISRGSSTPTTEPSPKVFGGAKASSEQTVNSNSRVITTIHPPTYSGKDELKTTALVPEPPPKKQKIVEQPPKSLSRGSSTPTTEPSPKVFGGAKASSEQTVNSNSRVLTTIHPPTNSGKDELKTTAFVPGPHAKKQKIPLKTAPQTLSKFSRKSDADLASNAFGDAKASSVNLNSSDIPTIHPPPVSDKDVVKATVIVPIPPPKKQKLAQKTAPQKLGTFVRKSGPDPSSKVVGGAKDKYGNDEKPQSKNNHTHLMPTSPTDKVQREAQDPICPEVKRHDGKSPKLQEQQDTKGSSCTKSAMPDSNAKHVKRHEAFKQTTRNVKVNNTKGSYDTTERDRIRETLYDD